ncbi:protocadherin Fat 3 [Electrophorus electricus]|uniref:protocadherin Fat 3 n=1 Tax=Electrophorus electricus TaxID=8005 RepID=UPI0015CFAF82|nr:protocadherin Fat 3 [Electrophorus electricus]
MAINRFPGISMEAHLLSFSLLFLHLLNCCWGQRQVPGPSLFQFTSSNYNATIYENSPVRSYVRSKNKMGITLTQSISWNIRFSIDSGNEKGLFQAEEFVLGDFCFLRIHTNSGDSATLNREAQDNYTLSVKAVTEDGLEASATVHVQIMDMNDLRPLFSPTSYTIVVPESTPLGTSVTQVTATDADIGSNGEFYYFFREAVEWFAVHPTSGVISLTDKLNADQNKRFDLQVLAVDRGKKVYGNNDVSSTAKVMITITRVNEYSPTLNVIALIPSLSDKDPVYAVVTVADLDEGLNGEIEWVAIVSGDPLEQFLLDRAPFINEYMLKTSEPIDWNEFPYGWNLTFQAKDRGIPPRFSNTQVLHLLIKKPQPIQASFEKDIYKASVNEMAPPGTIIEAVAISPRPRSVSYGLSLTSDSIYFNINTFTGVISTARQLTKLDQQLFELEVTEAMNGLRATVQITVEDANDNIPTFTQASYQSFVNESAPIGTVILKISATDNDKGENGCIAYSIPSPQPLPFTIDQYTGELKTSKELDFESSVDTYVFVVRASDWGFPYRRENEVNITVRILNVNDNPPLFEHVSCKGIISHDFPIGQTIITLSAIDIDEMGLVKYEILSGNEQDLFNLNPDSGILSLRRSLSEANVKNVLFSLKIAATDGEIFSESTFVNVTLVRGRTPLRNFNCKDTKVAQTLAENLLNKANTGKSKDKEDYTDLYSVNWQTPQFESFPSEILVREDLPVGSTIIKVNTNDCDAGLNGHILYVISDGNTDSCFNIDMESGHIYVYQPLDHERSNWYLLNVTIYDMGLPPRSSWRLLTVNIEDVNDNSPQFSMDSYTAVVPENTVIGTEVIQVTAIDNDLGKNGEISYTLLTHTSVFSMNASTGWVYVSGQLDRESMPDTTLEVEARDKAESGHQKFSVTTLKVYLEDVNDCPPVFIPKIYSCCILEDLPLGTVITWLQTQDPDSGAGGRVKYALVNDYNGTFTVNMESGAIKVTKELDYEKQKFYNLSVIAEDCGPSIQLSSYSFVEVEVFDVNENLDEPYFSEFAVRATVWENARLGTSVVQVMAKDDDRGRDGIIRYSIKAGSGLGWFSIDEETGVIYTSSILDCEIRESYWLTVCAADQGVVPLSASIEVFIQVEDVNDNAPLTTNPIYHPYIMENSPKGVSVVQIQAHDPDDTSSTDRLTYRIKAGNPQNFFTISSKAGLITTTSRKLDREQQAEHFLEVTITDGSGVPRQSTVWVIVHVQDENDNKPEFPQPIYCISLPERDRNKRGEPVYRVFAHDPDQGPNAQLTYSIVDGNEDNKFSIDAKSAVVSSRKTVTAGDCNMLTIKATDNGSPQKWATTQLHIEWIRKPLPPTQALRFTAPSYNFAVAESTRVSESVGVISVLQPETQLWFEITGGRTSREKFYIPQSSCVRNCTDDAGSYGGFDILRGRRTIVVARPLDAESQSLYNMTVQVTDGTNKASTQVYIKVLDSNDNAPAFSQSTHVVSLPEDTPADTEVLKLRAIDKDERAKLSYSVHGSGDPVSMRMFRIHPGTGVVYTADRLDYEAHTQHILTIMVKDQEFPYYRDLAQITVNVEDANDQNPFFTHTVYDGVVTESASPGTPVVQVTALDRDTGRNGEIVYLFEAGNTGGVFGIDSLSGIISVARELDLTFAGHYALTVRAMDGGTPALSATATVRITISLSDLHRPKFTQLDYQAEIRENAPIGTLVTHVKAVSRSLLVYDIMQGNSEKRFGINCYTGVITTQMSLDFEATTSYALVVQAVSMAGIVSSVTVNIQVMDENDNPPMLKKLCYSGSISEAAPSNSVVLDDDGSPLMIQVTDADRSQNALLVFQIVEDVARLFFTVDSGTGSIRTITSLDYETFSEFHFHVNVRDSGSPQLIMERPAEVVIKVMNINDSPPKFSQDAYESILLLPTYVGVEALRVEAFDPDMSTRTDLIYSLADSRMAFFAIESSSGILTVKNDKLAQDGYRFTVKASAGRYSCTALVTILVREAMESDLLFSQSMYSSSVVENSSNISNVAVVSTTGSRLNEPIKYGLLNAWTHFTICPTSGVIQTTGVTFDREQQEFYELVVEVSREHDPLRVARVNVRVQVEDINDNAPEFVGLPYYAVVQLDAQPGSSIFRASATDLDKGMNGKVFYDLKEEYSHFDINSVTGELTLKRAFVANLSNAEHQVIIFAHDAGYPSLFSAVELLVTVVNKAMPVFDKSYYGVSVREDISLSTPIISINATGPEGQTIIYTIVDGDPLLQFDIGFDNGVISVIYPLDYETISFYKLTVRSTDTLTGARSEVNVDIIVVDVNDNAPVFEKVSYTVTLSENTMIGSVVVQLLAADKDSEKNGVILYQILSEDINRSDYFHIESRSGLVLTGHLLDYEVIQRYQFIVRAVDNGSPAQSSEVMVTVLVNDTNDNPPSFNQPLYEAFVSVLVPRGHFVTCIKASDADISDVDRLRYSILSGDEGMTFTIDSETGVISLSKQFRQGMCSVYILNVSVSDGVFTSPAQVSIRILGANVYSPVFSQRFYVAEVQENAPAGTKVIQVWATDDDSGLFGQIVYSFSSDLAKTQFSIGADGMITTAQPLDRENPLNRDIVLTVMALDGGGRASFCSVRVMVTDENDNAPCFRAKEYRVSIRANIAIGSLVTQIQALDPDAGDNGRISYSLYSEARLPLVDVLEIEPDSGWMVTKASMTYLRGTVLSLFVKATDNGVPAKHSLVSAFIHVLPPDANIPTFTRPKYSFSVSEDTPIGTALGSVCLSPGQMGAFSVINGETMESNQGGTFIVERDTGLLRLVNALDYELVNIYHFTVSATMRQALVESMSVVDLEVKVLDVNDNNPSFETSSYTAMVMEGLPVGTRVIQVHAVDPDWGSNGQVIYMLGLTLNQKDQTSTTAAMFAIDSKTGWISTLGDLDHETCPSYTFSVIASDLGKTVSLSSTASVTVAIADVNDNPPTFDRGYYRGSVTESDAIGEVVSVLSTRDRDTSDQNRLISIHITGGDPKGVFALAAVQGEWKVFVKQPLDREGQDRYLLNITATDGLFITWVIVEVTVMDANDNSPICNQALYEASFPEDIPINNVILNVGATDFDIGSNAEIQYSLYGNGVEDFYMDSKTGELKTASLIDREKTPGYKLIAQATDAGGLFCRSEISLTVLDVNDNAPSFFFTEFLATVFESAASKTLLTRLQASDPDEGLNRRIVYSLVDSANGIFSIEPFSGVVILEKPLDHELQDSYRVRVQASDQAGTAGSLSTQVDLTVLVLDVNDNPPVFQKQDYSVTVPEDVAVGSEVLRVLATSEDIGVNAEIYYSIRTGNELGRFSIDETTGTISVAGELDYEVCKDYFIKVEAVDGGTPPLKTSTMVTIDVMDVNDNAPAFSEDVYNVLISEDAAIGETVTTLLAEDMDSQVNGHISYSILRGDRSNQFWLDPVTAVLKVNKALDRETVSSYTLTVQAFDSGSPAMSTAVIVNIEIADINDNTPVFSPANASAVIQLNKPAGTTVLTLSVSDNDSPRNAGPFEFRIVSGNEANEFSLDQNGELCSNKVLDAPREYVLQIQAWDSGEPRLSSSSFVFVHVIGDSLFRLVVFPLEISVVMAADAFPGGFVGKVHVSNGDENNVLSFIQRPQPKSPFTINQHDGKIVALRSLEPGRYFMNVTVSDGLLSETIGVTVQVEQATEEKVQNAVMLHFHNLSPEEFVALYLQDLKKTLWTALAGADPESGAAQIPGLLHVLGIQPVGRSSELEVLLAVEAHDGGYVSPGELVLRLGEAQGWLGGALLVVDVVDQSCSGELDCGESVCELSLRLESSSLVTYSTPRVSFASPHFSRTESCTCADGLCPLSLELCEGQPCPSDMQCVRSSPTAPSVCKCLPGTLDHCAGQTSLSFAGNSYIKYRLIHSSKGDGMKLGLRIRTLQSRGVIMYTHAEPCTVLKIKEGHLCFQPDCNNSLDTLDISGWPVNDGSWHSVTLELTRNRMLLVLDDGFVERRRKARAPTRLWPLATEGVLFFGARVPYDGRGARRPQEGFQGCLGAMMLNGNELPLQNKQSRYAEVAALSKVRLGCVLYPDPCLGAPCQNGADCVSLPSGAFACGCSPQYTGVRCEMEITSCMPTPCMNGGNCRDMGSMCGCPQGLSGPTCTEDVNECEQEECENGGKCASTFGAFYCNCTAGFEGPLCGQAVEVADRGGGAAGAEAADRGDGAQADSLSYVGPGEVIGIGVLLLAVLVLLTLLTAFRKRLLRKGPARAQGTAASTETAYALHTVGVGSDSIEFKAIQLGAERHGRLCDNDGVRGPPQILVRPTTYTLPHHLGSPGGSNEGKEARGRALATLSCPPLLTTFHVDPLHMLGAPRRGVAVCSVAPNLPSVLTTCPTDHSPVPVHGPAHSPARKPPWEEDEEDEEDDEDDENEREELEFRALEWEDRDYQADGEEMNRAQEPGSPVEETTCFSDSSTSEGRLVRSDSCDDSASIVTVIRLVNNTMDSIKNEVLNNEPTYNSTTCHWETTEWLPDACMPGLESAVSCQARDQPLIPPPPPIPAPPTLSVPPPLLTLSPTRLGSCGYPWGSACRVQAGYSLPKYEGQRDFSPVPSRDECSSPVYEGYRENEERRARKPMPLLPCGIHEGEGRPACCQPSHGCPPLHPPLWAWEERPTTWLRSHPLSSLREPGRLSERHAGGEQLSPLRVVPTRGQDDHD